MIKRLEFKKIISSPIILGLFVLFLLFNCFLIYQQSTLRHDMKSLQPIVKETGTLMNDEGREKLKTSHEEDLNTWNQLSQSKTGDTYQNAADFYKPELYYSLIESNIYSETELQDINELAIKETYLNSIQDIETKYSTLNVMENAEEGIRLFGLEGAVAEKVREQYSVLRPRVEELIQNKEHLHLFFHGKMFGTHSFLFKTLFGFMLFQGMILIVLFTAFIVNYEFEHRTALVTYATKRGRRLMWDKLLVSTFASTLVTVALLAITLSVYFIVFDYSGLWNVPISTGFLIELNKIPFISWWNVTFIQYLLMSCGLVVLCHILFVLITFCLSMLIRNSYIVFTLFGVIFLAGLYVPSLMPKDSTMLLYTHFSPFILVMNVKKWWMESGVFTTFKYYEIITVTGWLIVLLLTAWLLIKRFARENI
ncbi:ABC transporter permease subunit [Fictibacillus sp. 23RED33]|uniref:ABC transporter permease subunit n=1 Tax=Fictibacillus sp. 23RED33 TaxID=2745879 RepID=UPI0018CD2012|nr:ABC transporter permease subunit [Fictibacillus sp. 23RED33]MBH0175519.1 ABC transporter permease subunit [Fictibacillus sp. 23RED33]